MDMPLVFGLLVVLNAVFLAWQFFEQQNRGQNSVMIVDQPEGKPLQLLAERPDLTQGGAEVEASGVVEEEGHSKIKLKDTAACYRIGPLLDPDMARQVRSIFEKGGFDVSTTSTNTGGAKYLLYIPPVATTEKAESIVKELQKQGIDASVITESSLANGISLGTVGDFDQAESIKSQVAALGYRADTKTTLATRQEQWLIVGSVYSAGKTQIDRLLVGSPQLHKEKIPCN
jgi:hypothetical protein